MTIHTFASIQPSTKHKLLIQQCLSCAKLLALSVAECSRCHRNLLSQIESSGFGFIVSSKVVEREVDCACDALMPQTIAIVELDDGPGVLVGDRDGPLRLGWSWPGRIHLHAHQRTVASFFAVTLPRDHQDAHQFECNPTAERGFARYALIASSNEPACVVCQLSTHFAYPDPDHRVAWPRVHDSPPSAIVIISESKDTAIHFPPLTAGISAECMNKGANTLTAFPWVRDGPSVVHRGTSTAHSRGNSPFCDN